MSHGTATTSRSEELITRLAAVQKDGSERMSMLVQELSATTAAERQRADDLADALAIAKAELEVVRAQSQAAIDAARDATARDRDEAARLERELQAALEIARTASAGEASLRDELASLREQFQQIIDRQTLQLLELTREPARVSSPPPARQASSRYDDDDFVSFDAIEAALAASPLTPDHAVYAAAR